MAISEKIKGMSSFLFNPFVYDHSHMNTKQQKANK